MGNDHRQRVFMVRADMDEMNVETVDFCNEVRQGLQLGLALAPVILCRPIACEFLRGYELHALRFIGDRFPLRPLCRVDAATQIHERLLGKLDDEGADRAGIACGGRFRREQAGRACGGGGSKNGAPGL